MVTQILDAMNQDSRVPLAQLQVDGGMTSNRLLMQLQADILGVTVGENVHTWPQMLPFLTVHGSTKPNQGLVLRSYDQLESLTSFN